jgi:hypothetical protein
MNTHNRRVLCSICVAAGLAVAYFLVISLRHPELRLQHPPGIKISFSGYSNAPDGQVFARFALSNMTDSRLLCVEALPRVCSNGQWSMVTAAGQSIVLQVREQGVVSFPKPAHAEAWRVPVFHGRLPPRPTMVLVELWRNLPWRPSILDRRIEGKACIKMQLAESDTRTD